MTNCETNGGSSYTTYFYGVNAQGDVEKIFRMVLNSDTGLYEEKIYGLYTYDVWGNVTATTAAGNAPATTTLVYRNPIRYRGYYYDSETGFYYLQSRYYDPANRRFINADGYASTGQGFIGCNMFAYCGNNPVICADVSGRTPFVVDQLGPTVLKEDYGISKYDYYVFFDGKLWCKKQKSSTTREDVIAYEVELRRERLGLKAIVEEDEEDEENEEEYWGGPHNGIIAQGGKTWVRIFDQERGAFIGPRTIESQYQAFLEMVEEGYGYDPVLLYD